MINAEDIKNAVNSLAASRGWKLGELAQKAGVTPSTLSRRISTMDSPRSSLSLLGQLADALGVSVIDLLAEVGECRDKREATNLDYELTEPKQKARTK